MAEDTRGSRSRSGGASRSRTRSERWNRLKERLGKAADKAKDMLPKKPKSGRTKTVDPAKRSKPGLPDLPKMPTRNGRARNSSDVGRNTGRKLATAGAAVAGAATAAANAVRNNPISKANETFSKAEASKAKEEKRIRNERELKADVGSLNVTTSRKLPVPEKKASRMARLESKAGKSAPAKKSSRYMSDEEIKAWNRKNNPGYWD